MINEACKYTQNNEFEHIFYSVVGKHGGKTVPEIIERKKTEVNKAGYSLWSAKIDEKSKEQVQKLSQKDRVWVLCKISMQAKDPFKTSVSGKNTDKNDCVAKISIGPDGDNEIPKEIKTTYPRGRKNYQAYVVNKYIDLREKLFNFNIANYMSTLGSGNEKTFFEWRENTRFQNVYGKIIIDGKQTWEKEIEFLMELKYPFVVDIKK